MLDRDRSWFNEQFPVRKTAEKRPRRKFDVAPLDEALAKRILDIVVQMKSFWHET